MHSRIMSRTAGAAAVLLLCLGLLASSLLPFVKLHVFQHNAQLSGDSGIENQIILVICVDLAAVYIQHADDSILQPHGDSQLGSQE